MATDKTPDTICAVATPPGLGGLSVVRVSGPRAFRMLDRVMRGFNPSRQPDHSVRLGRVVDDKQAELDEVMVAVFRAPRSYTGEDVAEVSCHGGDYIAAELVRLLCRQGCRRAGPGEFSRRAVLNRRLSLSRAEAVLDLINARTPVAHRAALARYNGDLSRRTRVLLAELEEARTLVEHHIGFCESDTAWPPGFARRIRTLLTRVTRLLAESARGRFLHEGARVAIVGRPNVGKSTLFNRLVGEDRAIVTSTPGTTRDRVEATVVFGGVPVMLADTAGMPARTARTDVATRAADRTAAAISEADLLLAVFDGSQPLRPADRRLLRVPAFSAGNAICIINKVDIGDRQAGGGLESLDAGLSDRCPRLRLSALTGDNVGRLRSMLIRRFRPGREKLAINDRHRSALEDCRDALKRCLVVSDAAAALAEIEAACAAVAEIDAPPDRAEILDRVFSRFCVGK